jgi:anthranilate synthase component 1/para-aminobenzoate synthetase
LAPPRLLILEGVGAASSAVRAHASLTVWLEVPESDRRARAVARDWDTFADHWDDWAKQEAALMEREQLVSAVDLVLSGVDATVSDLS